MSKTPPMLSHTASGLDKVPATWRMEAKLDGWRWQMHITADGVRSYAGRGANGQYSVPPVEEAMLDLPPGTVLDGELLPRELGHQSTMVSTLLAKGGHGLIFVAFDVLSVKGYDVTSLPWEDRRRLLDKLAESFDPEFAQVSPVFDPDQALLDKWLDMGLEGAMVKNPLAPYTPGKRTRAWLKIKPQTTDDGIVTGFDEGAGKFQGMIGAIRLRMVDTGVETTASGMTDAVRQHMTDNPGLWIGRTVEIKHHGLHPRTRTPRHPQFSRLREPGE